MFLMSLLITAPQSAVCVLCEELETLYPIAFLAAVCLPRRACREKYCELVSVHAKLH